MAFPIDEKGLFNIFNDFEFVRPHKGALVFLDSAEKTCDDKNCERVLVQYERFTGKLSPGFIVPLRTEVGETYVLETRGFLHEGKKAFIYGEARGLTGAGPTGPTGPSGLESLSRNSLTGNSNAANTAVRQFRPPTILDQGTDELFSFNNPETSTTANQPNQPFNRAPSGAADKNLQILPAENCGCHPPPTPPVNPACFTARVVPRDYFFRNCEETCYRIEFTALTHHTDVGILFYCNTIDYCLSLSDFLVYKAAPGCYKLNKTGRCEGKGCVEKHGKDTHCAGCLPVSSKCFGTQATKTAHCGVSPCGPVGCITLTDCCEEDCCIRNGPTGPPGIMGATGAPGRAGTRTFCLDISRTGFAGRTLPSLDCTNPNILFLETGVRASEIAEAFEEGRLVTSDCVKLWQCDGTQFQWILTEPADYVFYDVEAMQIWIIQNHNNGTLLFSQLGDLAVNSSTGDVLVGNSFGQWIFDGCNLRGPTGTAGPTGAAGPTGEPGPAGPVGPTGPSLGSAVTVQPLNGNEILVILNLQGSLVNFVSVSTDASSLPVGTVTVSEILPSTPVSAREIEINMTMSNILYASEAPAIVIPPGQHVSAAIDLNLSLFLLNKGFIPDFVGNPVKLVQIEQDDIATNIGFVSNVYATLANDQNQIRIVIVYYNLGPDTVTASAFQRTINLSLQIKGQVLAPV
jgi:hypothetical protein